MYPIKLKVHGIRDFIPTELDLGDEKDHVLIGGKNGSGKSTLVYAASFALVSGRVSIDGLRSKLTKRDERWHAGVSMLFYNPPGPGQKDAPPYVQLSAEIRSRAGTESRQLIYSMSGGENPDMLIEKRKFQSRQEAHDYYKRVFDIDVEGYFMFWYQGSITAFTNISDAQRFERVAEMFGIDKIKEEWDEARRAMEEAEDDFLKAKAVALKEERRLQEYEKRKNALEIRDNLRAQGLILYETCYREINKIYEREIEELSRKLTQIGETIEKTKDSHEKMLRDQRDLEFNLDMQQDVLKKSQDEYSISINVQNLLRQKIEAYSQEKEKLETKVKDIQNKLKYIHRPKEQLQEDKGRLKAELEHLSGEIQEMGLMLEKLDGEKSGLNKQMGNVEFRLRQVSDSINGYTELDKKLPDINSLSDKKSKLETQKNDLMLKSMVLSNEIQSLKARQAFLQSQNSPILLEQVELLEKFRSKGIKAVAFGEIFEVNGENIFEKTEEILAPLKHVIFVERLPDDIDINVPFYVVDMQKVRDTDEWETLIAYPECKSIFEFVCFSQKAVEKYGKRFLDKIEMWFRQVVILDKHLPETPFANFHNLIIYNHNLWDDYGIRGPFDTDPAIGEKAQSRALVDIKNQIVQKGWRLQILEEEKRKVIKELKITDESISKRCEVNEKLPSALEERGRLQGELDYIKRELAKKERELKDLRKDDELKKSNMTTLENGLKQVEGELAVYAEYEKEAVSVQRMNELTALIEEQVVEKEKLDYKIDQLQDSIRDATRKIKDLKAEYDTLCSNGERLENRLVDLDRERQDFQDRKTSVEIESEEKAKEYGDIKAEFGQVIADLEKSGQWVIKDLDEREKNRPNLQRKFDDAKRTLDEARQRVVDEDARQKYNDFLVDFNNAKKEMDESELRFNILKKKEEEKRSEYDKNVYYRWQRTNQRFADYMQRLHMVGNIVSVPPDEEGKNKAYRWELHVATKIGHKPERISPESGRIVGEGISGGERAAVSLVFALALLSDIENKPPFYVLDEFDSALDEERKHEIFDLYQEVLDRKMIIVSPKVHGDQYLNRFSKFLCVVANPGMEPNKTISEVYEVTREGYKEADLEG
jgi:chromosome segregation protein